MQLRWERRVNYFGREKKKVRTLWFITDNTVITLIIPKASRYLWSAGLGSGGEGRGREGRGQACWTPTPWRWEWWEHCAFWGPLDSRLPQAVSCTGHSWAAAGWGVLPTVGVNPLLLRCLPSSHFPCTCASSVKVPIPSCDRKQLFLKGRRNRCLGIRNQ